MVFFLNIFSSFNSKSISEKDFQMLFDNHYTALCRFILKIVKEKSTAEDIVQETYIKLWEKRNTLQISTSLKAYLYRAAMNAALTQLTKAKKNISLSIEGDDPTSKITSIPEENMESKELEGAITKAISMLPAACQEIFLLSRYENLSYKEIADTLSISIKTVENQMGKALKHLREQLKNYITN